MHLSFNSIDELNAFLNWVANAFGRTRLVEPVVPGVSGGIQPCTRDVAFDTPPAAETASTVPPPETPHPGDSQVEQAARRKRRTKAEIEADNKAAAETAAAVFSSKEPAEAAETPAGASAAPEGANPFAAVETAAETPATPAGDAEAADTTVTPFQHLTRAREFIAKHGMPKYNESFAKAGLDANVMGYSAYQRALHMDALAALEAA